MRVSLVGTADAFSSAGRGNSCYWLDGAARSPLMVDFGPTALQGLRRLGRDPDELRGLLFTHLHGDHFGGFAVLHVALTFQSRRERPLAVVGPRGTRRRLESLLELAYGADITEHARFGIEWTELDPGQECTVSEARIRAFAAEHLDPPEQALCLRVEGRDETVVAFSGDTAPCDGLLAAADGADLLVAECSGLRPPIGRHTTWEDWKDLLPRIGARRVVLSHLSAEARMELPRLLEPRASQAPAVAVGEDGMEIPVRVEPP